MKPKSIIIAATVILGLSLNSFPQQPNGPKAHAVKSGSSGTEETGDTLESIVPREGLRFYVEIGSAGLTGLSGGNLVMAIGKMLAAEPLKVATTDLVAFVMGNAAAFSKAKLALVSYGGTAAIVEAANVEDAEQLRAGLSRLLSARKLPAKSSANDVDVAARGRIVVAGARSTIARLTESNRERTISDDPEFMKARSRFSQDPIFAFIELGMGNFGMPVPGAADAAYTMGALAALSGMPYAMALGGSIAGDTAKVRALFISGSKQTSGGPLPASMTGSIFGGLFSSLTSGTASGQPMAAGFALPNSDLFVDLMIDWDKLLDSIQSMFAMFAGALAGRAGDPQLSGLQTGGGQNVDLLAMLESSLGFSIKHDLIPTLGNEIAFSLSGLNNLSLASGSTSTGRGGGSAVKKSPPQFMLLLAVRDAVKFEKLLSKLISGPRPSAAPMFSRTSYRGVTITSTKSVSYTITGGFLLAGGSAAEIRRALDAQALGSSLAFTQDFQKAMGDSKQGTLLAYVSSRLTKELYESLAKESAKSGGPSQVFAATPLQTIAPIGLSMMPEEDGFAIEAHLPASLAVMGLTAMFNARPAPYGIGTSTGIGIPDSGATRRGSRGTPTLTNDDLRHRRP